MTQPNIVLIMTDQQHWHSLGAYGNQIIQTPHLDRLATEGVLFENAFVPIPLCTPSRASLFTGQRPSRHGIRANETFPLHDRSPNLVEILREAGYTTLLAGKDHIFGQDILPDLFDQYVLYNHAGRVGDLADGAEASVRAFRRPTVEQKYVERDPHDVQDTPTVRITDEAMHMVQSVEDQPFFLWLSYPDPHPPFVVSEPYASMYRQKPIEPPIARPKELEDKPLRQQVGQHFLFMQNRYMPGQKRAIDYSAEDIQRIREIYYGMITLIDDQVGRFVQMLEGQGLAEETILIFMSDHGDFLGNHGLIRKSPALYDDLVRIPLFLRWPGHIQPTRIQNSLAESIDLAPTLLDLLGLPIPQEMEGQSMAPVLYGQTKDHKGKVFALYGVEGDPYTADDVALVDFAEMDRIGTPGGNWLSPVVMQGRFAMIRTLNWKLVYYKGGEGELYHLADDPHELHNLYDHADYTDIQFELMRNLLDSILDTLPVYPPYQGSEPPLHSRNPQ